MLNRANQHILHVVRIWWYNKAFPYKATSFDFTLITDQSTILIFQEIKRSSPLYVALGGSYIIKSADEILKCDHSNERCRTLCSSVQCCSWLWRTLQNEICVYIYIFLIRISMEICKQELIYLLCRVFPPARELFHLHPVYQRNK